MELVRIGKCTALNPTKLWAILWSTESIKIRVWILEVARVNAEWVVSPGVLPNGTQAISVLCRFVYLGGYQWGLPLGGTLVDNDPFSIIDLHPCISPDVLFSLTHGADPHSHHSSAPSFMLDAGPFRVYFLECSHILCLGSVFGHVAKSMPDIPGMGTGKNSKTYICISFVSDSRTWIWPVFPLPIHMRVGPP